MFRDYLQLPLPVRILCLGSLINRAGSFVLVFLSIYASEQLGFGVPFATACIGVLGLGSMAGSLLGGHLADKVGRRGVMLLALFGGAAILLFLSTVTHRWLFMLSVGVFALVADLYRPAAAAMIGDLVSIDRRPHAFALMYISINLGFAIAPPIGGLLAGYSFEWLFWIDAASMIMYGGIIALTIEETHPRRVSVEAEPSRSPRASWIVSVRTIGLDLPFLSFCISTLLIALVFVQGLSTLPIYIRQLGYSNLQFGLLMSVNGLLIVVLQLPLTHWLSRFNAMTIVLIGGVLISIGFGLTATGSGLVFVAVCIAIWTLGEILQAPFNQAIVTDMAPDELRGSYLGIFTMCYASALTIGAPIGGAVLYRFGPTTLWTGTFVVAMMAVAVYGLIYASVTRRVTRVG
ncbi:MFS transporter [Stieleria sp. ICT_E10.1]|uniref:MDR family MFS transporter n=1 Tax=Stieleria sedimenti TaxID=2976331 RepID=UPI00217F3097|nr:MFS transporter [Stieleria sedimenti]MCS7468944.1 MFS transporter [Stieleria sedimenti]